MCPPLCEMLCPPSPDPSFLLSPFISLSCLLLALHLGCCVSFQGVLLSSCFFLSPFICFLVSLHMGRCVHFSCNPYFLSVSHCLPSYFLHASCCFPSYWILCPPSRVPDCPLVSSSLPPCTGYCARSPRVLISSCLLFSPLVSFHISFLSLHAFSFISMLCPPSQGLTFFFFSLHISFCLPSYLYLVSPYVFLHIRCLVAFRKRSEGQPVKGHVIPKMPCAACAVSKVYDMSLMQLWPFISYKWL